MTAPAIRTVKVLLWTTAAVSWTWAGVATVALTSPPTTDGEPIASSPDATVQPAAPQSVALPAGEPGSVLVLRLSRPAEPQVIVRREYIEAPAPAPAARPDARRAPVTQRSSGS